MGQAKHVLADVAPVLGEYLPAGQGEQDVAPPPPANVPGLHGVHPAPAVPGVHSTQPPNAFCCVPSLQKQSLDLNAWPGVEVLPTLQRPQPLAPAA